jgi:hypothetical protein
MKLIPEVAIIVALGWEPPLARSEDIFRRSTLLRSNVQVAVVGESISHDAKGLWKNAFWP